VLYATHTFPQRTFIFILYFTKSDKKRQEATRTMSCTDCIDDCRMFCFQCEQTKEGVGCDVEGLCGKKFDVAAGHDVLIYALKGIAMWAHRARKMGVIDSEADRIVTRAIFATLTNVNFDYDDIIDYCKKAISAREKIKEMYIDACKKAGKEPEELSGAAVFALPEEDDDLYDLAKSIGIVQSMKTLGKDVCGVQEMIVYGVKGLAAYADHAFILGIEDDAVYAGIHEILDFLTTEEAKSLDNLLPMALKAGELNMKIMEMLDKQEVERFGNPEITQVSLVSRIGKAILISGHDLHFLEELLKQTDGTGIDIYTHGEMLPAHAYPGLKKYSHLVGHYGGAWQKQKTEFSKFPGPIVMTSNCIIEPRRSYMASIYTMGPVSYPGCPHLDSTEFSDVIETAKSMLGFKEEKKIGNGDLEKLLIGFAFNSVMSVAGDVIEAVKSGKIKKFFLIGGCDGPERKRSYFTTLAEKLPEDHVILTLGCGKYRVNHKDYGVIPGTGIPRLLDCGQCNDAFSAIKIAVALKDAFGLASVNDLPLEFAISWFEQKAVAILLTLLHLGIKGIHLGPNLPAFVTPAVLDVLVKEFEIAPVTNIKDDFGIEN
jgi:hydroxylamine reductase